MQGNILSQLALSNTFKGFNKEFCKHLFNAGFKKPLILHVHEHAKKVGEILQSKNNQGETALDLLNNLQDPQYKKKVISLLDGTRLENDLHEFNIAVASNKNEILRNDNLITKIIASD